MKFKVIDCNETGLILDLGQRLSWSNVDTLGKCEYTGREITWAVYYLRKKGDKRNIWLHGLGGFPFFRDYDKEERERRLRLKVIQQSKGSKHLNFVAKTTHFGKEKAWNIEKEEQSLQYSDSPCAQQIRKDYRKNLPIILFGFFSFVIVSILILWIVSNIFHLRG